MDTKGRRDVAGGGMLQEASLLFIVWRTKGAYGCGQMREVNDKFFEIK